MAFIPLDAPTLIVLMVAGAAMAGAGLWLMFRPKPETGAAKLELFGLKFEASSAGLLVFLIGAFFLATPLVVPRLEGERPVSPGQVLPAPGAGHAGSKPDRQPVDQQPGYHLSIDASEAEPNDTIPSANLVALGSAVSGRLERGSTDVFAVAAPAGVEGVLVANLTVRSGRARMHVHDDAGEALSTNLLFAGESKAATIDAVRPGYSIALHNELTDASADYTLSLAFRPAE